MNHIKIIFKELLYYRIIDFMISPKKFFFDSIKDLKSLVGIYKYKYNIVLIVGLPKSGTTWIENFLFYIPGYVARRLKGNQRLINNHKLPFNAFDNCSKYTYSYLKTHLDPLEENFKIIKENKIDKIIILYRDPRDTAISRYFHLLKSPKSPNDKNYKDYSSMSMEEGITHSITIILDEYIDWINGWLKESQKNSNGYLLLQYEALLENPINEFNKINSFYNFELEFDQIDLILQNINNDMKKGFNIGKSTGSKSTFRKGVSGDWKVHFSTADKQLFKNRAGNMLIRLGYEKDLNW